MDWNSFNQILLKTFKLGTEGPESYKNSSGFATEGS